MFSPCHSETALVHGRRWRRSRAVFPAPWEKEGPRAGRWNRARSPAPSDCTARRRQSIMGRNRSVGSQRPVRRVTSGGWPMTGSPQLRPLGDALGMEALGIDLSQLDDASFGWIERAFAEHPVLVFRNQRLGAADIAAFGRRFGTPRKHALMKYRHSEYPEVSWLTNVEEDGKVDWYGVKRATDWHTDSTYEEEPPLLAMLYALEVPSTKGGTMFADMRAAYDALPEATKQRLATLTGLHGRSNGPAGERLYGDDKGKTEKEYQELPRPAVTH